MLTDGKKECCVQLAAALKCGAKKTIKGGITQKTEEQHNINFLQTGLKKP